MNGIHLHDDDLAVLLAAARAIPDDAREQFFADVADLLRPAQHRGIEARDLKRAVHEARRLLERCED